ncbi:MAG: OmpA family protein [Cyclobacteriaceae bacterium]|nr:OmpA family protein [Cyclobacteriaceae bacterium]
MKRVVILTITLVHSLGLYSQQNLITHLRSNESRGDKMYYSFSYGEALTAYKAALEKDPENGKLKLKIAESYRMLNDAGQAANWYSQIIENSEVVSAEHILHYAQALTSNGQYGEALKWYQEYKQTTTNDRRPEKNIQAIETIRTLYQDSLNFVIEKLGINSPASDFSPAFYREGIVFVSSREHFKTSRHIFNWDNSNYLDLYYSKENENGNNEDPIPLHDKVNSIMHEGPTTFYDHDRKMIFTRNNISGIRHETSSDGIVKLKLFSSEITEKGEWKRPKELPFNSDEYSVGHPTISNNGMVLIFASDMPGGHGGTDLYYCLYNEDSWSKPINLGKTVNTEGNDLFPFLAADSTLYFASNGHGGLGGLDIFSHDFIEKKSKNMGYPINSASDDFGLIIRKDNQAGYFSSNRNGGRDKDNIYHFSIRLDMIEVNIFDQITHQSLHNTDVQLHEGSQKIYHTKTDLAGMTKITLRPSKNHVLRVRQEGYLPVEVLIPAGDIHTGLIKIPLTRKPDDYAEKTDTSGSSSQSEQPHSLAGSKFVLSQDGELAIPTAVSAAESNLADNSVGSVPNQATTGEDNNLKPTIELSEQMGLNNLTGPGNVKAKVQVYEIRNISGNIQDFALLNNKIYVLEGKKFIRDDETLTIFDQALPINELLRKDLIKRQFDALDYLGNFITINNIYYDFDQSTIRNDASIELDELVHLLKKFPVMNLELKAHTDSRGSDVYNKKLALRRAMAARTYLINEGIEKERIIINAYGEKLLVNDCGNGINCDESMHQKNRRTEFVILYNPL